MHVSDIVTPKGRQEIVSVLSSELVNDWDETDRTLKRTVRMLLVYRPDLVRNYFFPEAWARIATLDKPEQARIVLAALKAVAIAESGEPEVTGWTQALFYMNSREPRYVQMAVAWSEAHPEQCKYPLKAKDARPLLPKA